MLILNFISISTRYGLCFHDMTLHSSWYIRSSHESECTVYIYILRSQVQVQWDIYAGSGSMAIYG